MYVLASATITINVGEAIFFVFFTLQANQPRQIVPHLGENIPFLVPGSAQAILNVGYDVVSIVSFIMMWSATCLLMRHYSQTFGWMKFWVVVSLPMVYFISQFITFSLNVFAPLIFSQSIFYGIVLTLIYIFSKPVGGALFGIAFWSITRKIPQSKSVQNYMIISAYGLTLLFTSNQANVLLSAPYPPFGLAAASIVGLSSYLILIGIYSSAISVAQDTKLRQSIKRFAIKESRLLDSIGTAQMEQELLRRVMSFTKDNQNIMTTETGVESSLTEAELKEYLEQVMQEVKKGH
jgi:hypothetical protein